jgi:hypothetical protein
MSQAVYVGVGMKKQQEDTFSEGVGVAGSSRYRQNLRNQPGLRHHSSGVENILKFECYCPKQSYGVFICHGSNGIQKWEDSKSIRVAQKAWAMHGSGRPNPGNHTMADCFCAVRLQYYTSCSFVVLLVDCDIQCA